jgi:hypothetical protein
MARTQCSREEAYELQGLDLRLSDSGWNGISDALPQVLCAMSLLNTAPPRHTHFSLRQVTLKRGILYFIC